MAEIRAEWRRTWQTAPYESESVVLSMSDTVQVVGSLDERAKKLADMNKKMFAQLAEVGDSIMQERIGRS